VQPGSDRTDRWGALTRTGGRSGTSPEVVRAAKPVHAPVRRADPVRLRPQRVTQLDEHVVSIRDPRRVRLPATALR
jgi:hypothetical protein